MGGHDKHLDCSGSHVSMALSPAGNSSRPAWPRRWVWALGRPRRPWPAPQCGPPIRDRFHTAAPFLFPDLTLFHAEAPGYPLPNPPFDTDPANADPSTITDFNGAVGLVYVGGQGTHHNLLTGEIKTLYWEVDLRFMTGQYVGYDGRLHTGTFGFV
jgi:hypothetical protein